MSNTNDIANEFNDYFANIGKTLSQAIPRVDTNFSTFLFKPLTNSLFLSATSLQEIQDFISSLGKACGPFSIPVPLLKILKFVISKPVEILYNFSFSSGSVPDAFIPV